MQLALLRRAQRPLAEAQDRAQDVVEVVRDAAGQRAHRLEPLGLPQAALQPRHLLLLALALGDVAQGTDKPIGRTVGIAKHGAPGAEPADLTVGHDEPHLVVVGRPAREVRLQRRLHAFKVAGVVREDGLPLLTGPPRVSDGKAEQFLRARGKVGATGPKVPVENAFVRPHQGQRVALLGLPQFLLGPHALGHVGRRHARAQQLARRVTEVEDRAVHPADLPAPDHASVELQPLRVAVAVLVQQCDAKARSSGWNGNRSSICCRGTTPVPEAGPIARAVEATRRRGRRRRGFTVAVRRSLDGEGIALFGTPQRGLGLLALGILLFELGVELGVLKRDGGLGREQVQHRAARRREHMRREVVLEVEHPDEIALMHQGQAQHRATAPSAGCIRRARTRSACWHHPG